jgi:hypothetical protein
MSALGRFCRKGLLSRTNEFSRGAGALIRKLYRGHLYGETHGQSGFQPAALVTSLQGVGSADIRFDGRTARFCRQPRFEFFNLYFEGIDK